MNQDSPTPSPATPETPTHEPPKRRRRLLRWIFGLLAVLVLLLGLVAGFGWWAISSEKGTGWLLTRAGGMIPGELTVGSQRGPLTGPLELRDVHYRTPEGLDVRVNRAELAWRPRDLLSRQLDIDRLHAEGIRVVLPPAKKEEAPEDGRLVDIHLPVNIIVRDALIRNLEIVRPGEEPFRLNEIALDAQSESGSDLVRVRSLRVDGPGMALRAEGSLTPVGDYPVDLRLRGTYDPPDYPPFTVAGALTGTLEKLGVDARLSTPFDARVTGHVLAPMRELEMDLAAQVQGLAAQEINPEWPLAHLETGNVKIRGKLDEFTSEGTVNGSYEDFGTGRADYRLVRRGEDFFFEYLNLKTENGGEIGARGTVATGGEVLGLDLVADWRRFGWPLRGRPQFVSRQGEATIRGTLEDYRLEMTADLAGQGIPPGRWTLAGRGTQEKMDIRSLRGDVLRGQLAADGTVSWKPQVTWNVKLTGKGLNPGAFWAEWPGNFAFAAASQGTLRDAGPFGRVDLADLEGNLRGNPLAGIAHVDLQGDRYRFERLDLRSGSARVTASGVFAEAGSNLDWKLDAPNLGEALPDAGGSLTAAGNFSGPLKTPRVRANLKGTSLVWKTYRAAELTTVADVDLRQNGTILIDLDARDAGTGEQRAETIALDGRGTRRAHELTLALRAREQSLDLALAGGLAGSTTDWNGEIRRLDLVSPEAGTWGLAGPAGLRAGTTAAALRDFCWASNNGARLCAQGEWAQAGAWSGSGTIDDLPFSLFQPFLPPDLEITGGVEGSFNGRGSAAGVVTADVDLRPGPGEIRYPLKNGDQARVAYEQGLVTLTAGADGLLSRLSLAFRDTGTIAGEVRLPQYNTLGAPLQQQQLTGKIAANLQNLSLVEGFVPDLDGVQGALTANLTLGGTVAQPKVIGAADLIQAQADVPRFGLQLRQVGFTLRSDGQGPMQIRGSAKSGEGTLALDGTAAMDGQTARLTVGGRRVLVSNTREIKVLASPDLNISMAAGRIDITGEVVIPEAEIRQKKKKPSAVAVSRDVYIVPLAEEGAQAADKALEINARIRVVLGDDIEVAASGFSGKPRGSLLVTEQPGKATVAVGELEVKNGIYKAYGQDLTLERGRLIFAGGPIDNPGLDLRAFRKADDGTVAGINVRGTLKAPETTLYSDPPMGQSEALAYLLLGRPLGQASPQEGDLLANAANSLGLKGGNLIAKRLASRFGLEEARVESSGGLEQASLVVGKYLSPRLYVAYGFGLFEPLSTLRIRYLLGRQWTLQAETGTETSADILYNVELGKGGTVHPSSGVPVGQVNQPR